jgi:hypothetical protein
MERGAQESAEGKGRDARLMHLSMVHCLCNTFRHIIRVKVSTS